MKQWAQLLMITGKSYGNNFLVGKTKKNGQTRDSTGKILPPVVCNWKELLLKILKSGIYIVTTTKNPKNGRMSK